MQDIDSSSHLHNNLDRALGTFLYTISCMHCMTVSLSQGGVGLGTCWGVELRSRCSRKRVSNGSESNACSTTCSTASSWCRSSETYHRSSDEPGDERSAR